MSAGPRHPYVDGTFYPAQREHLGALVDSLLAGAARTAATGPDPHQLVAAVGLLVPHAGLVYSGSIAALGWRLAGTIQPTTIVLAGTDHQALAAGIGVWTGGPWQTPLGSAEIDRDLATEIFELGPPFAADDGAHLGEHSIEVQLPFILRARPGARIVPLAVSPRLSTHREAGAALGRLLAAHRARGEKILLAASSDMAHYPTDEVCRQVDAQLLEPLLRLDAPALHELESSLLRSRLPGLLCGLCGIDPVRVTIAAALEMGAGRGVLLGAATSADAGGDPRRTVGYASAAFV